MSQHGFSDSSAILFDIKRYSVKVMVFRKISQLQTGSVGGFLLRDAHLSFGADPKKRGVEE